MPKVAKECRQAVLIGLEPVQQQFFTRLHELVGLPYGNAVKSAFNNPNGYNGYVKLTANGFGFEPNHYLVPTGEDKDKNKKTA